MAISIQNNLYPPIFKQSYMPAFIYTEGCRIYFSISQYNNLEDLHETVPVQVTVQDQKTNQSILDQAKYPSGIMLTDFEIDNTKTGQDKYYIEIESNDIQDGFRLNEYNKVQLRFTGAAAANPNSTGIQIDGWLSENNIYFSQWSTIVLIYGISEPTLELKNLTQDTLVALDNLDFLIAGKVIFEEENDKETLKSYHIYLYDNENNLIQDSKDIYLGDYQDQNEINYNIKYSLEESINYTLKIQIVTNNLYSWDSPKEYIFKIEDSSITFDINLECTSDENSGSIKIVLNNKYMTTPNQDHDLSVGTKLVIKRGNNKNNFSTWEKIRDILIEENAIKSITCEDYTIEPGVWYKYKIIRYNSEGQKTSYIITKENIVLSEDIFLIGDGKQLRIRFDPQITNFSIKVSESSTETIGSQYPYIKRNGNTYYKTFTLSGTISCFIDLETNLMQASKEDLYGTYITLYNEYNTKNNITLYNDYVYEKDFRNKVIQFLYKNNVKLFRSLTQGNMLVKLMNISFTPNQILSRRIYSFSCTVCEVDESNAENYDNYNIVVYNQTQYEQEELNEP